MRAAIAAARRGLAAGEPPVGACVVHAGEIVASAHNAVDEIKRALGERGPVWWDDGSPDLNRHMAKNTPYADWYASL